MRIYPAILLLLMLAACRQGERIEIRGTVENGAEQMIYLDELGIGELRTLDSTRIKQDGRFSLTTTAEIPGFYQLHLGSGAHIPLLAHPGDRIEVQTRTDRFAIDYVINGSERSRQLQMLNRQISRSRKKLDSIRQAMVLAGSDAEQLDVLNEAYAEVIDQQRDSTIRFVLENRNSLAVIFALYQRYEGEEYVLNNKRDIQLFKICAQALDTLYPESEHVRALKLDAEQLEAGLKERVWRNLVNQAPGSNLDIRLPNPYGDTIALSSLQGKVVILSFWASGDEASIRMNRNLKALYNRYHDRGLELYQVAFEESLADWMKAISDTDQPGIHVSELTYPESVVASTFNVENIPKLFIVDRSGTIIGQYDNLMELEDAVIRELARS